MPRKESGEKHFAPRGTQPDSAIGQRPGSHDGPHRPGHPQAGVPADAMERGLTSKSPGRTRMTVAAVAGRGDRLGIQFEPAKRSTIRSGSGTRVLSVIKPNCNAVGEECSPLTPISSRPGAPRKRAGAAWRRRNRGRSAAQDVSHNRPVAAPEDREPAPGRISGAAPTAPSRVRVNTAWKEDFGFPCVCAT